MLVDALLDVGLKKTKSEKPKTLTPEQKIKAIEEEALNKGWTYEQLWAIPNNSDYSKKGLIYFIEDNTAIGEVTEKHIALIHERPVGGPVIHNFYNMNINQPGIKKITTEENNGGYTGNLSYEM